MEHLSLPNEMLASIFAHLAPNDLYGCTLGSHRLRAVAERLLYASITLSDVLPLATLSAPPSMSMSIAGGSIGYRCQTYACPPSLPSPLPHRTRSFCSTILKRQDLAEGVKRLSVRWHPELTSPSSSSRATEYPYLSADAAMVSVHGRPDVLRYILPVLQELNAALRTLPALESLDLALGLPGTGLDPHVILEYCTFPHLRYFALSGVGRGALPPKAFPSPTPTVGLSAFLIRSPELQHLRLADCYEPLQLPPDALPVLSAFRGSAPTAATVLPGRPVQLLSIIGDRFVTEASLRAIASTKTGTTIRWLDLSGMSVTPLLLRDFSKHIGSGVEFMKVKLALRHTLHHALSGITLLVGLTSVLGDFPSLRQLDLSPTNLDGVGQSNEQDELSLCTAWARGCPTLFHVLFPSKMEWVRCGDDVAEDIGALSADAVADFSSASHGQQSLWVPIRSNVGSSVSPLASYWYWH